MSLTSGPISETEQAGEKFVDHLSPKLLSTLQEFFALLWNTKITIEISKQK
jgi:hypothetical protein